MLQGKGEVPLHDEEMAKKRKKNTAGGDEGSDSRIGYPDTANSRCDPSKCIWPENGG